MRVRLMSFRNHVQSLRDISYELKKSSTLQATRRDLIILKLNVVINIMDLIINNLNSIARPRSDTMDEYNTDRVRNYRS